MSEHNVQEQLFGILLYASSSVGIMFMNKIVLTTFGFPSAWFLAFAQYVCTMLTCSLLKCVDVVHYPEASKESFKDIMPLPVLFLANALTGLSGTKRVNLPMFTVLRRFSIFFTMVLEWRILRSAASPRVQLSVFLMILGSVIAAIHDVSFDFVGYSYVLLNDVFTAFNGVVTKQGILFHNTLYSTPVIIVFLLLDTQGTELSLHSPLWGNPRFCVAFLFSSMLGCLIQYSTVYCTKVNSALTTTVVGCLKNILTTYVGMLMVDYKFTWYNFVGLNISIAASLFYSYTRVKERKKASAAAQKNCEDAEPSPDSVAKEAPHCPV